MRNKTKEENLESMLAKLESITKEMEDENMDLDSALQKYEEGVGLYRKCRAILERAETKIEMIKRDDEPENEDEL